MGNSKRVVLTGIGIVTALGIGKDTHIDALRQCNSGISNITSFDASGYSCKNAGEVKNIPFNEWFSDNFFDGRKVSNITRGAKLLFLATNEALQDRPIHSNFISCPIVLGNTLGGMESATEYYKQLQGNPSNVRFSLIKNMLAYKEATLLSKRYNLTGQVITVSNTCSSSASAIGMGRRMIIRGRYPYAIVGGYEPLCEFTHSGFCSLHAITSTTCKPFDMNRDGMVLGEGAAILFIEDMQNAIKDNVNIYAEIVGYGEYLDTYHLTKPNPSSEGAIAAMQMALRDSELTPDDIDVVIAHATATEANDPVEAYAIEKVFQECRKKPFVTALKPIFGHTLGAASSIEATASILALKNGFIPPILNHHITDDRCKDISLVLGKPLEIKGKVILVNSFGFGGLNVCIIYRLP